jgi:hypothetical protein
MPHPAVVVEWSVRPDEARHRRLLQLLFAPATDERAAESPATERAA